MHREQLVCGRALLPAHKLPAHKLPANAGQSLVPISRATGHASASIASPPHRWNYPGFFLSCAKLGWD